MSCSTDVKIKICGLCRPEDVAYVNEAKPDFCGFVINVPGRARSLTPEQVRTFVKDLSPDIVPVGVFLDGAFEMVAELLKEGVIRMAQLHGNEDETYIKALKAQSDFPIIKAFREETFAQAVSSSADYVLLDHAHGGTGVSFDWALAAGIDRPFFLAGGIGPDNVVQAIEQVHPWAVDMSSKVETDGKKDREKIMAAVQAVRQWNEASK